MGVEVRPAVQSDAPWLFEQIAAFQDFVGFKKKLLDEGPASKETLAKLISDHVVLIAHERPRVERMGFIAGYRASHPFNQRIRVLSECFWWVAPEYRGGRAGAKLLREFELLGRAEADWVVFSLEHNSPVREKHLLKRGFRQIERAFLLEV